eukprot:COSAG02_NODE_22553_length_748_cov_1.249615_1_plen_29_part_10
MPRDASLAYRAKLRQSWLIQQGCVTRITH